MGSCFSKKKTNAPSSAKSPDPNKSAINKPETEEPQSKKIEIIEDSKPIKLQEDNSKTRKEVFVIKHRKSHETPSPQKSTDSPVDVDAILIQCGRLSRSNSASAAKTRKRTFDADAEEADVEDGGEEEEAERRIHRNRNRTDNSSPRRRRTPSRERSGGNGSRRVSKSPGRRCEIDVSSVSSSNNDNGPRKFVSVPATERVVVKRNVVSPRTRSPATARGGSQPSPKKVSRRGEGLSSSPYRRNPLGDIDVNAAVFTQPQGGGNKKMINRDGETQKLNPVVNTKPVRQAPNRRSASPNRVIIREQQQEVVEECKIVLSSGQAPNRRSASPNRVIIKEQQKEVVEECKVALSSGAEFPKPPQTVSRSRSLRKSRDFDFSPEAVLESNNNTNTAVAALPSYTALLLEDIQNFTQKSVNVNVNTINSKACSIVEAIEDLNSTTKKKHERTEFNKFTSVAATTKKTDLMEPSFEKYVTVKRGGSSMEDTEAQESSGSNSFTGSSGLVQKSTSWEPNSAESTDRVNVRSNKQERDRSPLGMNVEFDPLKKNGVGVVGRKRVDSTPIRVTTVSV